VVEGFIGRIALAESGEPVTFAMPTNSAPSGTRPNLRPARVLGSTKFSSENRRL
jgi:hypothetical protein